MQWGESDKDDGPVDRRPGERAHRDCAPRAFRGAGRAAKSRAIRGVLLFGSFFLDRQEKATCRGSATHKYTPPEGRLDTNFDMDIIVSYSWNHFSPARRQALHVLKEF